MPSEREKKRLGTSQEKHVSVVGRRDISLRIRAVQQKEESLLHSVKNKDIFLLVAKEIVLHWKVVKTANREKLAMAKKELEDKQTKWEVTLRKTSMSVASKGIQHLHLL